MTRVRGYRRLVLGLIAVVLLTLTFVQYSSYLTPTPTSRLFSTRRFPDFQIYFADLRFDLDSRSISYRLQMNIQTSKFQGDLLFFSFQNQLTGRFDVLLNSTSISQMPPEYAYDCNKAGFVDKLYGLSEPYPYDFYVLTYRVYVYVNHAFDFDQNFAPYVIPLMSYPESLSWVIQGSATPIKQEPWQQGYAVSFDVTLTVARIAGYSSMISLVPVWAGYVVLGSSLFLTEKKPTGKVPKVADRLTVYISLFVFIPGFMYLIGSQIPLKWLLSTAELFLVALLSSTAAFAAFSSISTYDKNERSWDHYAVVFSTLALALVFVDPLFYIWNQIRADPLHGLTLHEISHTSSLFVDARVVPWMVLIAASFMIPYAKVHRDFKDSRLAILLVGISILCLTSLESFHDPTLVLISISYIVSYALFSWNRTWCGLCRWILWIRNHPIFHEERRGALE
jgi:hypothetical protein